MLQLHPQILQPYDHDTFHNHHKGGEVASVLHNQDKRTHSEPLKNHGHVWFWFGYGNVFFSVMPLSCLFML